MGLTAAEKILSRVVGRPVQVGEIVYPVAELVTVHDWYAINAVKALEEFNVLKLYDPARVAIFTDHEPLAVSTHAAQRQKAVREAASRFGISHFYDVGRGGLGHVFGIEAGLVRPGMFASGYDTHITSYGAIGCLATAVVTEVSELLACGSVWLKVPETSRVILRGQLRAGVTTRDIAQKLIGSVEARFFDDAVVDFAGPAVSDLDIDARLTLVNTPMEMGARTGFFEPDDTIFEYCRQRNISIEDARCNDPDCELRDSIEVDLDILEPQVASPPRPENTDSIQSVQGTRIQHAYIGSCASGMISDLRSAASILDGRKVHPRVRLFVTPATQQIARMAAAEGLIETFIDSGAIVTAPGCGVCAGGRIGPVASGETSISTGTRNDYGRLGVDDAELYLASPLTVAASAITGEIADPRQFVGNT